MRPLADAPHAERGPNVAFALPLGMTLSGVDVWSVAIGRELRLAGRRPMLLVGQTPYANTAQLPLPPDLPIARLQAVQFGRLMGRNLATYERLLPAVFVPNHSRYDYATIATLSRRHARRLRVIGMLHSDDPYPLSLLGYYHPLIHRFIAVSDECAMNLRRILPTERRPDIFTRPYGVEVAPTLRRCWSAPDQPLRLLYAGRIDDRQKRVGDMLDVAAELDRRRVDFTMRIIGEGWYKPTLLSRWQQLSSDLRARIQIQPAVTPAQIRPILRQTDILLLSSAYEGTSIIMLEAMAEGCVPVVTAVSGTAAAIEPGLSGYTTSVGDIAAMARAIENLAINRPLLAAMGARSHDKALKAFSLTQYTRWFAGICGELWKLPPRPWPNHRRTLRIGDQVHQNLSALSARVPGLRSYVLSASGLWTRLLGH